MDIIKVIVLALAACVAAYGLEQAGEETSQRRSTGTADKSGEAATILANLQRNPDNKILLTSLAKTQKSVKDKQEQVRYLEVCYLGFLSQGDIKTAEGAKRSLLACDPANQCCAKYPVECIYVACPKCGGTGRNETACPQCDGSGQCSLCGGDGKLPGVGENTRTCSCATTGKPGTCKKCTGKGKIVHACKRCASSGKVIDTGIVGKAYLDALRLNESRPAKE